MKLSHKIVKLLRSESYTRGWRRFQRKLHPISLQSLLKRLDQQRIQEIETRYATSQVAKYAHVERWLKANIERVQDLKLNRMPPQEILDLGCGGGFLLYICQQLGHQCLGVDMEGSSLYTELIDLFRVERKICEIKPFTSLPDLGQKFNWITAFSTGFNRDRENRIVWGVPEWNYFLDDLSRHLAPRGKMFFEINSGRTKSYYPEAVRELFAKRGASLEREYVFFPNGLL